MTEIEEGDAAADAGTSAADDQAADEKAQKPDLEAEVAKAAKKQQRERITLDSFTDQETRDLVQRYTSQQINEYRRKSVEDGELFTKAQAEAWYRAKAKESEAIAEAKAFYRECVAELGLKRGSEDHDKFEQEANSGIYNLTALGDQAKAKALVEKIAKNAQVGPFRPKQEIPAGGLRYVPPSGTAVRVDKEGKQVTDDPLMADFENRLRGAARG